MKRIYDAIVVGPNMFLNIFSVTSRRLVIIHAALEGFTIT